MVDFIIALLDDDHGISERAYKELCKLEGALIEQGFPEVTGILNSVKATDGRYYLSPEFRTPH